MVKDLPISKVYEALSALADNRVKQESTTKYLITSSDYSKTYTVIKNNEASYSSNDNATYWQHYSGYPIIAVLLFTERIKADATLLTYFKGINWKQLNTKNKNKYDLSIKEAFQDKSLAVQQEIITETARIKNEVLALNLEVKGNRLPLLNIK
ncbi:MAG: hypothetical protein WCR56_04580 [Bacilli bacterium]